jgi:CII-binding regulator of phage lambda lysogenization HflD
LISALRESRLTQKDSTNHSPYTFVYGKEVRLLLNLKLNALVLAINNEHTEELSHLHKIYCELLQLEQQREQAVMTISKRQQVVKRHFDKSTAARDFQKDQLAMLCKKVKEKPYFHTKFESLSIGPY